MKKGVWFALTAYVIWGLFPVYWKWLHQVPAVQLLGHRIVWSFVILAFAIGLTRQWRALRAASLYTLPLLRSLRRHPRGGSSAGRDTQGSARREESAA